MFIGNLGESMLNKPRLANASRRNERNVALIVQSPHYFLSLLLSVAEVFGTFVSIDDEWIIQSFHILCYMFYGMHKIRLLINNSKRLTLFIIIIYHFSVI